MELWSNEWKKWVYVDGALAWYIVDEKTSVPLSIWELRQRQLPTFLAEIDAGEKKGAASGFTWTLHPGKNQMRVRPCNVAGREGIPSWITLEYANAN